MKTTLKLGRAPENDLIFDHKQVSREHCQLQKVPEGYLVRDLDSRWGTFLNNHRIAQRLCSSSDCLRLGSEITLELASVLPLFERKENAFPVTYDTLLKEKEVQEAQARIYEEFLKLETVYNDHMAAKKKLLRGDTLRKTGLRAGLSLIPFVGVALGQLSSGVGKNVREKTMELDEAFKAKYVCPKCFSYLGTEPFENLKRRGKCQRCGVKWTPPE